LAGSLPRSARPTKLDEDDMSETTMANPGPEPPQAPGMTTVSDDQLRALVQTARKYSLVVFTWGPNRESDGADAIIWEHGRRNASLRAEGIMPIVCPVGDASLAGLAILNTEPQRAAELMDTDPAVAAGVLGYQVHSCRGFPGDALPA